MEKESIAYFYLLKERVARNFFYHKPEGKQFITERESVRVTAIGVPEYDRKTWVKKRPVPWKEAERKAYMLEQFQKSGAEHYVYEEELAQFLHMEERKTPLFFMEEMVRRYGMRESVVLLGNPNELFESLFREQMDKVNYLRIICEQPEDYSLETRWLYQNYGIITLFGKGGRGTAETLVVDVESGGKNGRPKMDLSEIPSGSVYMDMKSEGEKRKWITKKRKDIHYLSPESVLKKWCRLDTTAQNGYNTRVKLEVL